MTVIDTDETKDPLPTDNPDQEILSVARKRYASCLTADTQNKVAALDDLNFLVGGENQWPPAAIANRKLDGRPIITVNSLPTYLHQVTNDQRMNTPAIKVHPTGGKTSQQTAKIRQAVIRAIEYRSNADICYQTAVNSAAAVGFGYLRLITEYESPTSRNQKICFARIRNALSVKIDPLCVQPDGSDMQYCFVEVKMAKDEFKRLWPKANAVSSSTIFEDGSEYAEWLTDTEVLVCDYYVIEKEPAKVVYLSNGEDGYEDEMEKGADGKPVLPAGITITGGRDSYRQKVMLYKVGGGTDILARTEILCKWIPVFPVYGDELDIQGRVVRSGIIRHAKGPAQMYNVTMTSATEEVALRSKTPYIGAAGQFKTFEQDWAQANNRAFPFLEYNPVTIDGNLAPPPRRNEMADIPHGFLALASHAADNIKKTTGLFDASLGAKGTATSGVQERAQQQEGDTANFHYADGLLRTIRHVGRCLNCMITGYYDGERIVEIMHPDNKMEAVKINQTLESGDVDNDMTCEDFSITVTAGASYSTMRQESAEFLTKALQSTKDPASAAIFGYLAIKNSDFPDADVATAMMESTLPPPAKQALETAMTGKEVQTVETPDGPLPIAQVPQAIAMMKQQIQQLGQALQKADQTRLDTEHLKQQQIMADQQLEPQRLQAENMKTQAALQQAEAANIQAQADLLRAQAEAAMAPQTAQADMVKAETDAMTAQVNLMNAQTAAQVDAAKAHAEALNGDETALEAWRATLESETKIRVADMMNQSAERIARMKATQPKPQRKTND